MNEYRVYSGCNWTPPISWDHLLQLCTEGKVNATTLVSLNRQQGVPAAQLLGDAWHQIQTQRNSEEGFNHVGRNPKMTDTATCENCHARYRVTVAHFGKLVSCPKCNKRFVVTGPHTSSVEQSTPPPTPPVQPPVQHSAVKPESVSDFVTRHKSTIRKNLAGPKLLLPAFTTMAGIATGCVIGYFAAHHFAFFGGLALIGQPYSPARASLVPGHMLLCGLLLGAIGLGLGILVVRQTK